MTKKMIWKILLLVDVVILFFPFKTCRLWVADFVESGINCQWQSLFSIFVAIFVGYNYELFVLSFIASIIVTISIVIFVIYMIIRKLRKK